MKKKALESTVKQNKKITHCIVGWKSAPFHALLSECVQNSKMMSLTFQSSNVQIQYS